MHVNNTPPLLRKIDMFGYQKSTTVVRSGLKSIWMYKTCQIWYFWDFFLFWSFWSKNRPPYFWCRFLGFSGTKWQNERILTMPHPLGIAKIVKWSQKSGGQFFNQNDEKKKLFRKCQIWQVYYPQIDFGPDRTTVADAGYRNRPIFVRRGGGRGGVFLNETLYIY